MWNEIGWCFFVFSASKNCDALVSPTLKPMHHDSVSHDYGWIKTHHTDEWHSCSGNEDTYVAHLHNNSCVYIIRPSDMFGIAKGKKTENVLFDILVISDQWVHNLKCTKLSRLLSRFLLNWI